MGLKWDSEREQVSLCSGWSKADPGLDSDNHSVGDSVRTSDFEMISVSPKVITTAITS